MGTKCQTKQRPMLIWHQKTKGLRQDPNNAKSGNPLMRNFTGRLFSNEAVAAMASEANVSVALRACARLRRPPITLANAADNSLKTLRRHS
jgi:hypothetical protein